MIVQNCQRPCVNCSQERTALLVYIYQAANKLTHHAAAAKTCTCRSSVVQHSGRCGQLERHPVIYMRWKEQFFVHSSQQDCGLTIAGFYYVALHRQTGQLRGFYYDPCSSPFQELNLRVCSGSSSVVSTDAGVVAAAGGGSSSSSSGRRSRRAAQAEAAAAAAAAAEGAVDAGSGGSSSAAVAGVCFSSYSFA
jgi:hypothetical protein